MLRLSPRRLPVALFVAPLVGLLPSTAAAQAPEVVARGLDNPRGVAIGPDGAVWVAEAGRGGSRPCIQGPEGERVCAGTTGAITRIADGRQRRVVRGLPSLATRAGDDATGPHDVAIRSRGQVYAVVGLGANPSRRARLGTIGRRFAHLFRITESGRARAIADIGRFETEANPDQDLPGAEVDSNPYSVLAQASRRLVVDAGGNTLLGVARGGRTSTLAVFPTRTVAAPGGMGPPAGTPLPMQSVPTSVTENRDGAIYVSELTGFPFPRGGARIYKVLPGSTTPQVIAEGFTNVIDLAFAPDGSLYVLEITANGLLSGDPAGALTRLRANGTRQPVRIEGLQFPGGLAVAANGDLFVSNRGTSAGSGQVLRVRPGA